VDLVEPTGSPAVVLAPPPIEEVTTSFEPSCCRRVLGIDLRPHRPVARHERTPP